MLLFVYDYVYYGDDLHNEQSKTFMQFSRSIFIIRYWLEKRMRLLKFRPKETWKLSIG